MAKRKTEETTIEQVPKAVEDRMASRLIAESAGINLDKCCRRIIYVDAIAVRVVPWRPFECWEDAMMAAAATGIEVVTVADGPRGLCERIMEAK